MRNKWRNIFFAFGVVAFGIMLTQVDFETTRRGLLAAGYRFPAVVVLWAFLYLFNTAAWYLIIKAGGCAGVKFMWLYKITVSGFALNYATPGGLMGGEPYRIMELKPHIGAERASSSVILYVMTHIFSHFWFWLISVILYVLTENVSMAMGFVLTCTTVFCLLGLWFFVIGYRKGLAVKLIGKFGLLPLVGKHIRMIAERNKEKLANIDFQIAALHNQNKSVLVSAVILEFMCRVCSAAEVYLIISLFAPETSFVQCVLILAFTTLFANLLFFMPLQIGGREGGFLMSSVELGIGAGAGIFTALIIRMRELVWTGLGLVFIKAGQNNKIQRHY